MDRTHEYLETHTIGLGELQMKYWRSHEVIKISAQSHIFLYHYTNNSRDDPLPTRTHQHQLPPTPDLSKVQTTHIYPAPEPSKDSEL